MRIYYPRFRGALNVGVTVQVVCTGPWDNSFAESRRHDSLGIGKRTLKCSVRSGRGIDVFVFCNELDAERDVVPLCGDCDEAGVFVQDEPQESIQHCGHAVFAVLQFARNLGFGPVDSHPHATERYRILRGRPRRMGKLA